MNNVTSKGKKILIGIGILLVILLGWLFFPQLQVRIGNTPPEEFNEQPHTEFIDFIDKLPHETDHYRIYYDDYYSEVVVVPLVEIDGEKNPIEEYERVWPTYEQYANEAIAWMKAEGADFASFDLEIVGQDFWPAGRKITY